MILLRAHTQYDLADIAAKARLLFDTQNLPGRRRSARQRAARAL